LGRRRISTSGFAYMATETAVFAVRSAKPCFSWDTCLVWNRLTRFFRLPHTLELHSCPKLLSLF